MGVLNFRKYSRVEVDIRVEFTLPGSDKPVAAVLSNVSEEGGSLVSAFTIPIAATLEFDIPLPQIADSAHVRAEVLWNRTGFDNGKQVIFHGLLFSRIDPADRERIHAFMVKTMSY